jgi:outer membrane protein TolC
MAWRLGSSWIVLGVLVGAGCRQQPFLIEPDYHDFRALACPLHLEPAELVTPHPATTPPPTTVDDTQRPIRYMSLREAIAIALEHGFTGVQNPLAPGLANDSLGAFTGTLIQTDDSIRVLAIDPAILANDIDISLSKFDANWINSLTYNRTEIPLGTSPTSFVLGGLPINSVTADTVNFSSGVFKPLPTGGVAGITFAINGQRNTPASEFNPAIQPSIQFNFEQPLLQGFGDEINQLRATHPGSILAPNALSPVENAIQVEGILITRIRLDQQRAEFVRNLNYLLLNVETAYWNLYNAYYQLYSRDEGLRYTYEYWRLNRILFEGGRVPVQTLEQIRLQYEQFRSQRLSALDAVLDNERQLRGLLGLPIEDGYRLVPADSPTLTPIKPDWQVALNDALSQRPELLLARQDLKFRQLDLIRQRNTLLPDLRFVATDQVHSLGSRLDGGDSQYNALHNLFADPFNNWTLGLQMNVPIGFRAAHAAVRDAQLNLQRSYINLRTSEDKAERYLALPYRQIFEFQHQIQVNQAALRAASSQLQAYLDLYKQGRASAADANLILALQNYSTSIGTYYASIAQYNNALVALDFGRGAIMDRDKVFIGEGPLPRCAQVRAVEHERDRTRAIVLKDISQPITPVSCSAPEADPNMPRGPEATPLSLPVLQHSRPSVPELPEENATGRPNQNPANLAPASNNPPSSPGPELP